MKKLFALMVFSGAVATIRNRVLMYLVIALTVLEFTADLLVEFIPSFHHSGWDTALVSVLCAVPFAAHGLGRGLLGDRLRRVSRLLAVIGRRLGMAFSFGRVAGLRHLRIAGPRHLWRCFGRFRFVSAMRTVGHDSTIDRRAAAVGSRARLACYLRRFRPWFLPAIDRCEDRRTGNRGWLGVMVPRRIIVVLLRIIVAGIRLPRCAAGGDLCRRYAAVREPAIAGS